MLSAIARWHYFVYYIDVGLNEPETMVVNDPFHNEIKNHYDLKHRRYVEVPFVKSVYHGSESVWYLGPKVWDIVPMETKLCNSFSGFEMLIRKWIQQIVFAGFVGL